MKKPSILGRLGHTLLFAFLFSLSGQSQEYQVVSSTSGNDSLNAQVTVSLFREFVKNNNFTMALQPWRTAFQDYPSASKNIYIDGVKIVTHFLEKETDEAKKSKWIDTLMLVYDNRILNYGQEGFVLGRKGVDLLKYRKQDFEKAYEHLQKSVSLQGKESEGAVLLTFIQVSISKFKSGTINQQNMVENFSNCMDILQFQKANETSEKKLEAVGQNIEYLEKMFAGSGAASCETLVSLYQAKFDQFSNDPEFLGKMLRQLEDARCQDSPLFIKASENQHRLQPNAESAYKLARLMIASKQFNRAMAFYQEALTLEKMPDRLAQYYYEMGLVSYSELKQYESARNFALKSIENDPKAGRAYILIANLYSATAKSCGTNDFEVSAVYWLVVDKLMKAKSIDPTVGEEADEQINRYKAHFPKREEAFFYGVNEGDPHRVGGWIQETTKARFLK